MGATGSTPTQGHRDIWKRKKILRHIYGDYYQRIKTACVDGPTLEVGSGSGNFREFLGGDVVSMDIQMLPWLDLVGDAHHLPFADGAFRNIALIDTLHHLQNPSLFLGEVRRVLSSGGRLVVVEPAITPISYLVYNYMHPEPVIMTDNPLPDEAVPTVSQRDPFDSNQAIPSLLFEKNRERLVKSYPELKLVTCTRFSLFTFVLSGGLRPWSLLPPVLAPLALSIEDMLTPLLKNFMAFRLLAILERA